MLIKKTTFCTFIFSASNHLVVSVTKKTLKKYLNYIKNKHIANENVDKINKFIKQVI